MGTRDDTIQNRDGIAVRVRSEVRVYLLGSVLCIALIVCSRNFADRGGPYFMAAFAVAGIAYLFAVRTFFASTNYPRRVIICGLVLAALWQVAFLRLPPGADDDIHRYVWDGRLQRLGYNPYVIVPSDPAVQHLHTADTRTLNNPDLPSPYPPGAQLFFRIVTAIRESTATMKIAFFVCDWVVVLILVDLLRYTRQPAHLVLVYAWNPLLALEGSSHIDILGALLLLVSVAALARRWRMMAAVSLGLAIAAKFLPIVLLPLYWKRIRIRDAVLAAALIAALYIPFLDHGRIPFGSLGRYVEGFRFNGPMFAILHQVAPPWLLAGVAVLVGLFIAAWLRNSAPEWSPDQIAWPMAASLFCAPAVFPWYLLWLLPFVIAPSTLILILWSVTISATYVIWHLRAIGGTWRTLPSWVMLVEYGILAIVAVTTCLHRIRRKTRCESAPNV